MVHLSLASLTGLLIAAANALPSPVISNINSTDTLASDQLQARYDPLIQDSLLDRRYASDLQPPLGYSFSWGIDGKRLSYGTSSGQYITRSSIKDANTVGNSEVFQCSLLCESTMGCAFFHPVQMKSNSEGNVICALYNKKQSKSAATYSTGPGSTGGTVVASYGFTRNAGPSSGSVVGTSSLSDFTTTNNPNLPAAPDGATLLQFRGCNSAATVPVFVNKNFPISSYSTSDTVWIVQHGSGRNFQDYFTSLRNVVGDAGVIIAPNFYASSDSGKWYQAGKNLAWNSNDWFNGADAVAPSGVSSCSSFDVYDRLLAAVNDKAKFPNLKRVFIVGHSAGSSMMAKYGMLQPTTGIRYVLANSPSMPYFTSARPNPNTACSGYDAWGYGFNGGMPRYVAQRNAGGPNAFRNWIGNDITLMTGDYDTYSRDQTGDQSCQVQTQGGQNRRDRGYAWWAYLNLLGGTSTNVTAFYGYDSLKQQGVSSLYPPSFNARYCVVDKVAHDNYGMFASDCGRAAINGASYIPPGPGPIRPA